MPTSRPPRTRRPVIVAWAILLGLVAMLLLPTGVAAAYPYRSGPDPVLTVPDEAIFVLGRAGDAYVLEADGDPVPSIGVDALPPGLRLVAHGDGSATVSGTPTGPAGSTEVEVRAQSAAGLAVETLTIAVQQAPSFTERGPVVFAAGEFASVRVWAQGYPAPGIGLEGDLPAGLAFDDNGDGSATISGTPASGVGSSPVTLTAVNVVADVSLTTTVRVVARSDVIDRPATAAPSVGPQREP